MLVINRNGKATVLSGWRAWLFGASIFAITALVIGFVAFILLGLAVTVGALLMLLIPIAIGVGLVASFFRSRRSH